MRDVEVLRNLVPIAEAPGHFPVAEKTLRNWRFQGLYPGLFVKLGGKVFVDLSELVRIVSVQKDEALSRVKRLGLAD